MYVYFRNFFCIYLITYSLNLLGVRPPSQSLQLPFTGLEPYVRLNTALLYFQSMVCKVSIDCERWGLSGGGLNTPLRSRGRENRGPDWIPEGMLEEEHPSFHTGPSSDLSNGPEAPFWRNPKQVHCCQSLSWHRARTTWDEETEQRPWCTHRRVLSGDRSWAGPYGGICPGPSCHRGGGPPAGELVLGHTGQSHIWHRGCPLPAQCFSPAGAPTSSPPCPCPPRGLPSHHCCLITRI